MSHDMGPKPATSKGWKGRYVCVCVCVCWCVLVVCWCVCVCVFSRTHHTRAGIRTDDKMHTHLMKHIWDIHKTLPELHRPTFVALLSHPARSTAIVGTTASPFIALHHIVTETGIVAFVSVCSDWTHWNNNIRLTTWQYYKGIFFANLMTIWKELLDRQRTRWNWNSHIWLIITLLIYCIMHKFHQVQHM